MLFFFPPCVDLNDLTAITPKQKLEDKSCSCERVRRLTLQFPERTFCNPRRATSVLLRTRCVWICCRERQIVVASYVIKSISLPGSWEYCTRFHYWFGPEIPCCDCFWPLTLPLCWGDTRWALTASWQNTSLKSHLDASPPDRTRRSTHRPQKGVKCVCGHLVPLDTIKMRVCLFARLSIDRWELNLSSREKCGLIEGAGRLILPHLQTAGQSMTRLQYISVGLWVCVKTPLLLVQRYNRVFEARLTFKMWIFESSETIL